MVRRNGKLTTLEVSSVLSRGWERTTSAEYEKTARLFRCVPSSSGSASHYLQCRARLLVIILNVGHRRDVYRNR